MANSRRALDIVAALYRKVLEAEGRLDGQTVYTPLLSSFSFSKSTDSNIQFKCENLQHTGSFKVRGALNKLLRLQATMPSDHVIAASTGNHGLAVAWAGKRLGIKTTIVLPQLSAGTTVSRIEDLGGLVHRVEGDALAAERAARLIASEAGAPYISPYNDEDVVAGQGTVGLEIAQQAEDLDAVFVAVGGGGLVSGIGAAIKALRPGVRVVGCWPSNAASMHASLLAGKLIDIMESETLSEATAGGVEPRSITFEYCQRTIDECILVSEFDIARAMRLVAAEERFIVEGAAAVAVAGLLSYAAKKGGGSYTAILCGRNITLERFLEASK